MISGNLKLIVEVSEKLMFRGMFLTVGQLVSLGLGLLLQGVLTTDNLISG